MSHVDQVKLGRILESFEGKEMKKKGQKGPHRLVGPRLGIKLSSLKSFKASNCTISNGTQFGFATCVRLPSLQYV